MKKNIVMILTGLAAIFLINFWAASSDPVMKEVRQPMQAAFQAADVTFAEANIQGWAKINEKFSSMEELKELAGRVEKSLSPQTPLEIKEIADTGFHNLQLTGDIKPGVKGDIVFQSLSGSEEERETYLIIDIIDTRSPAAQENICAEIKKAFNLFKKIPETNQLLVGYAGEKLTNRVINTKIKNIFRAAGGKLYGGVEDKEYISKTGYVSGLPEAVEVNGKKVNMQVAVSYNEIDKRTYVYIGYPLIFSDY